MKISTAVKEYLLEIEVRKFTPKTIRSYRNNLNLFLRYCETEAQITEMEDVSLATVRQFSLYMSSKGRKGSYINGLLKVAKAFIQYCYDEGYGGFNTHKNFKWCKQDNIFKKDRLTENAGNHSRKAGCILGKIKKRSGMLPC